MFAYVAAGVKQSVSGKVSQGVSSLVGMDDYTRGLLAGLIIGEGSFIVTEHATGPHLLQFVVGMDRRHSRFLHEVQQAVGIGKMYGPYATASGSTSFRWVVARTDELVELCNLLDADGFVHQCDWVAWRYTRFRTQLRQRLAARDYGVRLNGWAARAVPR
jgi:hypothetical protein